MAPQMPPEYVVNHLHQNPGVQARVGDYLYRVNPDTRQLEHRPIAGAHTREAGPVAGGVLESLTFNVQSPFDDTELGDHERFEDLLPLPEPAVNCRCEEEDVYGDDEGDRYDQEAPLPLPVMAFDEDVTRENRRRLGY